ncbi:hypothetical protein N7466_008298 [Penicillium verhagenii]|uniref:uncharacterized protein n=1 Tax=Penicillium verhagenii TaxID=1562060 RepID=UPI0025453CD8|nr:uncharacterized protein N7466_008298 [Penicillium verhagenii]KAJ5924111.1 hypothetical protein N7466_008298 [Penicillium verhagenii]
MARVENLLEDLLKRDSMGGSTVGHAEQIQKAVTHGVNSGPVQDAAPSKSLKTPYFEATEPLKKPETAGFDILDCGIDAPSSESLQQFSGKHGKHDKLSQTLYASLPSADDMRIIVEACGNTSSLFYQMQIVPYSELDRTTSLESMFARPSPGAHPVLIARNMLHVATALQHLHPDFNKNVRQLSEPPREMMRRLSAIATNIVTTNDDLMYCIEGVDSLLVESWFHTNGGNLRKGLVTTRRALTIAQLMGFHRPGKAKCKMVDTKTKAYPEFIWHRITALERYLCLTLGLPESTNDNSMVSEEILLNDTPMGRLDRIHSVVTSRILLLNQSKLSPSDLSSVQELDEELQKASKNFPDKWWLIPNLATVAAQPEALFWDMRRLFHHLYHYNLLIQLHLPYMLSSAAAEKRYGPSQIICVNSAREILSRFTMFHSFNRIAFSCRTIDFFGLMAAITLLIVHIDGHQHESASINPVHWQQSLAMPTNNLFAHQRSSDRALIENILDIMDEVSRVEKETMTLQISSILRRLMTIEAKAAEGPIQPTAQLPATGEIPCTRNSNETVRVSIPHFGVIEITQHGILFKDSPHMQQSMADASQPRLQGPVGTSIQNTYVRTGDNMSCSELLPAEKNFQQHEPLFLFESRVSSAAPFSPTGQTRSSLPDAVDQRTNAFPTTAGDDHSAGQNTDLAFFDSLIREIGIDEENSIDWLAWLNVP